MRTRTSDFLITLAVAALLGWWSTATPTPLPEDAAATEFSAARAMHDVRAIASTPHATGTPELAAVRATLAARLTELGFTWREVPFRIDPRAITQLKRWGGDSSATGVNLIAWRRGADSVGPAVALMAHYDGVWGSPAAADDAFGVAGALEVARAIPANAQRRDLILIFTDGEELGLLGAEAFFARDSSADPLADHVGVVINLEARGGSGLASMFQTNVANGALMALYRDAVRHPVANSIAVSIYERLPNGTDFTPALARGLPGFNIANIGDARLYHSPLATPEAVDPGSLQHLGAQALDLTRALLSADALPGEAPAAVFSDILGLAMFVYAPRTGWWLIAIAMVLVGSAAYHRRDDLTLRSSTGAMFDGLALTLVAALLLFAGNALSMNDLDPEARYYDRLAALPRLELQAVFLVLATILTWMAMWARTATSRVVGLSVLTALFAVAMQWYLPGGGPILTWPLLVAALSFFVQSLLPRASAASSGVAIATASLGLAWLGGFAHFLLLAVGADMPSALAALLLPALLLLAPLIPEWPRRRALAVSCVLVLAAFTIALWVRVDPIAPSVATYAVPH